MNVQNEIIETESIIKEALKHYTVTNLAIKLGVTQTTILHYKRGVFKPKAEKLKKIIELNKELLHKQLLSDSNCLDRLIQEYGANASLLECSNKVKDKIISK